MTTTDATALPPATDTATLAAAVRLALRRMAKSVTVITCLHEGRRYAMAATAVDALSMDPPSMILSVNRSASLHAPLAAGADFCINVLGHSHEAVSRACGGGMSGEDRFGVGDWIAGPSGVPILADAQASFVCHNDVSLSYGTHGIFVGRLVDVRSFGDVDPLVYLDGRYTRIAD
ncbi:MAG TPA: flavin reductase family protein [Sphingomonas sp.]|jgi:flavin reductase (DIM6/NTAB) family NADH-FMN oxidoreductase RutF|uniref:flavin reductase family protein n=1 Tax=Sphingomonas sp. TaxID=28214 RepID=UPI002ED84093